MIAIVNGVTLYYEKYGQGRPLIMVHGNGEEHSIFMEAADILKDRFTVYLVDSRGHGKSSPVDVLHYEDMAQDMIGFIEALALDDVAFYGFSDGGIIGLIAASRCSRITSLITSGANITPEGAKKWIQCLFRVIYFLNKDQKMALMLNEPHISDEQLGSIRAKTLVLAGSKDLIVQEETEHIAEAIPGAELMILPGESHGSYIIHKTRIAELILDFLD